ncbi:hypothetical protein [Cognataquiflexum aquatile]|uniref:hypothetical protein n=1 Tax=Cognataquiflexum aquatile TaxID=2249427 RepID=UPI001300B648|nr:hypothetical protein [Cognataquiflexum aquatile]
MNNYIKEIKAIAIFLSFIIFSFGIIYLIQTYDPDYTFILYFIAYISFTIILSFIDGRIKSKFFKKLVFYISMPGAILIVIGVLIFPFLNLIKNALIYFVLVVGIPISIFSIFEYLQFDFFSNSVTAVYVKWTLTVFIAVLFNFQIRKFINFMSESSSRNSEREIKIVEQTDYLLSEKNIKFTIYSIYFFVIIFSNISSFEEWFHQEQIINNKAIVQSFVTFIAFDRALSILNTLEFKPSDLLNKIIKSSLNALNRKD